jgi:RNA polymerase sigma factor (sigma-70 family)
MLRARKATPVDEIDAVLGPEANTAPARPELDEAARAALGGDAFALRHFLTRVAPIVRRVCRGVMGRENPDLEDAIQDSLIDLARALPQFRFEGSVAHYVAKISMRRAIGSRRRAHARSQQEVTLDAGQPPPPTFDGGAAMRADLVRNLLDELNEEQAKALLLRIMVGHSIEEIASITGVSVNTVKTRLRLAKNRLRGRLVRSGEARRVDKA